MSIVTGEKFDVQSTWKATFRMVHRKKHLHQWIQFAWGPEHWIATQSTPLNSTHKLQCVQNRLAHVVTKSPPFTPSVSLLHFLHWLVVKFRIVFKISFLTYKTLHEKHPVFLHSMLATSLPSRSLRSNKGITLLVCRVKTITGARAFHWCPFSLEQSPAICSLSHLNRNLQGTSQNAGLWLGLSPIDTSTHNGPLMLRNCFINFTVEQWFSCRATEPGYIRDITALEILSIDFVQKLRKCGTHQILTYLHQD